MNNIDAPGRTPGPPTITLNDLRVRPVAPMASKTVFRGSHLLICGVLLAAAGVAYYLAR